MGRSAKVEPVTDADEGKLSAEFAQFAQAIGQYATKITALESEVSELRSSNQALELALPRLRLRKKTSLSVSLESLRVAEVAQSGDMED